MAQKKNYGIVASLAGAALMISAAPTWAATVAVQTLLSNPSFENGTQTNGCPVSWTCTANQSSPLTSDVRVYTPTATQYTAGSDGLASGVVPGGTQAGYTPWNGIAGAGTFYQATGTNYVAGNDYTFSFWVGLPTHNVAGSVDDIRRAGTTIEVAFTEGASAVQGTLPAPVNVITNNGAWTFDTITLSAAQLAASNATGQAIGVWFFVSTAQGNQPFQVDFDIVGTISGGSADATTPLPAALPLFAGGLGVLGLVARRRKQKNVAA
jgi:hypothetical protein